MLLNSQFGMISLFNTLQSIIDVVEYRDQILIIKKPAHTPQFSQKMGGKVRIHVELLWQGSPRVYHLFAVILDLTLFKGKSGDIR